MVQRIPLVETDFAYVPLDEKDTLVTRAIPLSADDKNTLEARQNGLYVKSKSGPPGKSAYELWLSEGHTGTFDDYRNSLKGNPGKSAYELWLSEGHTGTFDDYRNSLKGKPGNPAEIPISDYPTNCIRMIENRLEGGLSKFEVQGEIAHFSFDYPKGSSPNDDNACGSIPYTNGVYFRIRQDISIDRAMRPPSGLVHVSANMSTLPFDNQTKKLIPYQFFLDSTSAKIDTVSDSQITYYFVANLICFSRPDYQMATGVHLHASDNITMLMRGPNSENTGLPDYPVSEHGSSDFIYHYNYYFFHRV